MENKANIKMLDIMADAAFEKAKHLAAMMHRPLGEEACENCIYDHSFEQQHPYGDGYVTENLHECKLGNEEPDSHEYCPDWMGK